MQLPVDQSWVIYKHDEFYYSTELPVKWQQNVEKLNVYRRDTETNLDVIAAKHTQKYKSSVW